MSLDNRITSELALVGCILEEPDLVSELKPSWFQDSRLAAFVIVVEVAQKGGKPVDISTVLSSNHGVEDAITLLRECQDKCHSPANFPYWRDMLVEFVEKDRLTTAASQFLARVPGSNGNLKTHITTLENELSRLNPTEQRTLTSRDCALSLCSSLEERMNLAGALCGLATGFSDLDGMLDGLQLSEFTVLASRPSVGKTAIACNMVEKICLIDKVPTLFLSLEMSASALCRRMLSCSQLVSMKDLKSGRFTEQDFVRFSAFDSLLKKSPLFIRESFGGMTSGEASSLIRKAVKRAKVKFVVLDYLQKLKPDNRHEKRTYEIAESSACLTAAAKETGVALLCLAQLNRESEREKGRLPKLSDLADSGQIERDADNVLLLHRDRTKSDSDARLVVAKQRDGETGVVTLYFDGDHCRFLSAAKISTQDIPHTTSHHKDP